MRKQIMPINKQVGVFIIILGVFLIMVFYKPTQIPAPWFDEGWTLSVARNWVEKGIYGRYLVDKPISPTLAYPLSVTVPVAVSFRFFGFGVFQGRLPGILFTIGSLLILYNLSYKFYSSSVAVATILITLFLSLGIHPILMGRQATAEMPAIFYLLLGYWFLWNAFRKSYWWLIGVIILWGIAIYTQMQPLPFFTFSLIITGFVAWLKKDKRFAIMLWIAWVGSIFFLMVMKYFQHRLEFGLPLYDGPLQDLLKTAAWVMIPSVRLEVLYRFCWIGIPTLLGICYAGYYLLRKERDENYYLKISLLLYCGSWLIWYALLSVGWPKYLFTASFLGSMFISFMLYNLLFQFNFKLLIIRVGGDLKRLKISWRTVQAIIAIIIVIDGLVLNFFTLKLILQNSSNALYEMVDYINLNAPKDALIETFDSELVFLLNFPMHYPPDQIMVNLNLRDLGYKVKIDYDPLTSDPDYLVVGPFSHHWQLYEPILKAGAFELLFSVPGYDLYKRVGKP